MPNHLHVVSSQLVVEGSSLPAPRQLTALFRLVDEAILRAWLVEHNMPLREPPTRPRLRARNALLLEPEYGRIERVSFGSPIQIDKVVRGTKRAAVVATATAATLGATLYGVNEALDQVSGTINRIEQIYMQIRDFGEDDPLQQEDTRILRGRESEPTIRADEIRVRPLP